MKGLEIQLPTSTFFKNSLQACAAEGILIDQPGFSTSMEGCWQQSGINTQSQPDIVSKALKGTHGKDNKSQACHIIVKSAKLVSNICLIGLCYIRD